MKTHREHAARLAEIASELLLMADEFTGKPNHLLNDRSYDLRVLSIEINKSVDDTIGAIISELS